MYTLPQVAVRGSASTLSVEPSPLTLATMLFLLLSPWEPRWPSRDRSWDGLRQKDWETTTHCMFCGYLVFEMSVSAARHSDCFFVDDEAGEDELLIYHSCRCTVSIFVLPVLTSTCMCLFVFNFDRLDCTSLLTFFEERCKYKYIYYIFIWRVSIDNNGLMCK